MKTLIILITALLSFKGNTQETTIEVNISDFETNEGKVYVALYNSEETFLKEYTVGLIGGIINLKSTVTFEGIENGIYAISVFQDKNSNGVLDTNFMGIPSEPTGTSNNAKGYFGPPKFEDAKFEVKEEKIQLNINL